MVVSLSVELIQGHPEYGCSVNMAKSLANFDVTIGAEKVPRLQGSKYFPYCGNLIDIDTLDVIKDFTRMEGTCMPSAVQSHIRHQGFFDHRKNSDARQSLDSEDAKVIKPVHSGLIIVR